MAAWGATHLELYMNAHPECPSTNDRPGNTPWAQQPLANMPLGACYRYHSEEGKVPTQMLQLPGKPCTQPPAAPSHSTRHTKSRSCFLAEGTLGVRQVDSPFSTPPQPREKDQTKKGVGAHPSKLPTPVRAARLEAWLEGYDGGQKEKLVSGFKRGFDVGYKGSLPPVSPHNSTSALQNPEEVDKKLSKESSMNRIADPFKQEPFHTSEHPL